MSVEGRNGKEVKEGYCDAIQRGGRVVEIGLKRLVFGKMAGSKYSVCQSGVFIGWT